MFPIYFCFFKNPKIIKIVNNEIATDNIDVHGAVLICSESLSEKSDYSKLCWIAPPAGELGLPACIFGRL